MEPGAVKRRRAAPAVPPWRAVARGFTLIELLVVVVIIGIVITFAVLSVDVNEGHALKEQARRLTGLLQAAHEESILNARELAVQFKDGGYRFYTQGDNGQWSVWDDKGGPFHAQQFPPGVKIDLTIDGKEVLSGDDARDQTGGTGDGQGVSDQTGVASMLPDGGDDQKKLKALVYILSSGELTPFELTLTRDGEEGYRITGTSNGDLSMKKYEKS